MQFRRELTDYKNRSKSCLFARVKSGQGTVEYAIVFVAFLAMLIGLGFVLNFFQNGIIFQHAIAEASHSISGAGLSLKDSFMY